jgi:hypothetical protein
VSSTNSAETPESLDAFSAWLKDDHYQLSWNLPYFHSRACESLVGPTVEGDDSPRGIAYRLMASVDAQYRAVLQTLIYADSSLGAQSLTRGLIEAWIHLDFVWSAGRPRSECRALSLELGWLQDRKSFYENLPVEMKSGVTRQLRTVSENLAVVEQRIKDLGCPHRVRRYTAIDQDVKTKAKIPGFAWVLPVWKISSEAVHMGGSDWLFAQLEEGLNKIRFPPPAVRATWYHQATSAYHHAAMTTLFILRSNETSISDAERTYGETVTGLLNDTKLLALANEGRDGTEPVVAS